MRKTTQRNEEREDGDLCALRVADRPSLLWIHRQSSPHKLWCAERTLPVDILHLPGVERLELGVAALSAEGYAQAVFPAGVDAQRDALFAVGEDFDDALVDEYPQLERLAFRKGYRGGFGRAREDIGEGRGAELSSEIMPGVGVLW